MAVVLGGSRLFFWLALPGLDPGRFASDDSGEMSVESTKLEPVVLDGATGW